MLSDSNSDILLLEIKGTGKLGLKLLSRCWVYHSAGLYDLTLRYQGVVLPFLELICKRAASAHLMDESGHWHLRILLMRATILWLLICN